MIAWIAASVCSTRDARVVGAVTRDGGHLAGRVEPGNGGMAVEVGLDAAHDVVLAGVDVDGLAGDVHAGEVTSDVDDLPQRLEHAALRHLRDVQSHGAV